MKYTGPKFKLCRREQTDLFGSPKYNIKKNRNLPGQHGASMQRYSEYGKLLRNKQLLKRSYLLTEKQFSKIVKDTAAKYSKNNGIAHDVALFQFLERRFDSIVYRAGFAKTMMQARQMVNHAHFILNGTKHNIPSTFLKQGDKILLKEKLQKSGLYENNILNYKGKLPSRIKINKTELSIEVLNVPQHGEIGTPADLIKVIEFYARA
ncbi:MAG: 30S ribosomal protein S4 [Candidatus Absconditabacterales bacterium]